MTALPETLVLRSSYDGPSNAADVSMLRRLSRALEDLGALRTVEQLVERAPVAICEIGFDRAMISRIHGSEWVVERFYSAVDPAEAAEITAYARSANDRLGPNVIELEMVRRRVALLVPDVSREPRVNPRLAAMTGSNSYVAAPVSPAGEVVGFLHADRLSEPVTAFDREVLALFAQEFGQLVSAVKLRERFERLCSTMDGLLSSLGGIVKSNPLDGPMALVAEAFESSTPSAALHPLSMREIVGSSPEIDALLSEREREVLRLMALGETNGRIASRLFITEGTVKSHVRHILRKLNAANRAEAVCRWLQRPGTGT